MAKLADALASGASDRKVMGVQVPLRAQWMSEFQSWFFVPGKEKMQAMRAALSSFQRFGH
jgi:hypothetical protein